MLLFLSENCLAAPTCEPETAGLANSIQTINIGQLTVSPDAAINSVLNTYTVAIPDNSAHFAVGWLTRDCQLLLNKKYTLSLSQKSGWSVANNISATPIPGLGMRISIVRGTSSALINTKWAIVLGYTLIGVKDSYWKVELIKTGAVGSGVIPAASDIATLSLKRTAPAGEWRMSTLQLGTAASTVTPTCTVTKTAVSVALDTISASKFIAAGTTIGDKAFSVDLTCDKNAKVSVSLGGTQSTETTDSSVLALTGTGQSGIASGVGVQLLYADTALKLNNNLLVKTSDGGKETLAFGARYYQTKKEVTVGKANTTAILNITYQ